MLGTEKNSWSDGCGKGTSVYGKSDTGWLLEISISLTGVRFRPGMWKD